VDAVRCAPPCPPTTQCCSAVCVKAVRQVSSGEVVARVGGVVPNRLTSSYSGARRERRVLGPRADAQHAPTWHCTTWLCMGEHVAQAVSGKKVARASRAAPKSAHFVAVRCALVPVVSSSDAGAADARQQCRG
jgi:hypothetical protein